MMRLTIAVPQPFVAQANHLASCLGYSAGDALSFGSVTCQDKNGAHYAIASGVVPPDFIDRAFKPLSEPAWSVDMEAAYQAQQKLVLWSEALPISASYDIIIGIYGEDASIALSILGLTLCA